MDNEKAILIANLQEQLSIFDAELKSLETQNPLDITKYNAIRAERDEAQKKLDAINAEINAGVAAQEEVSSQFDSIQIGDETVSLRDLTVSEPAYQILSIWFQQYVGDMAQKHQAIVQSYESEKDKLMAESSELATSNTYLGTENQALHNDLLKLTEELRDVSAKRDAAVTQLEESQEETKRLASDNESLRKQIETSNKPLTTNITTSGSQALAEWKASLPAVYDVVDQPNGDKSAKLLETGEDVVWKKIYPGKYRIASAEEVERFRQEQASEPVQEADGVSQPADSTNVEETVPDSTLVTPPPAIPSEQDAAVQVEPADGTVADEEATVLQRLERLERAVFGAKAVA